MCPSGHRPTQGHQVRELWASSLRDAGIDSPRGKLTGTCNRVLPLPQGSSPSWDLSARLVEPPLTLSAPWETAELQRHQPEKDTHEHL